MVLSMCPMIREDTEDGFFLKIAPLYEFLP